MGVRGTTMTRLTSIFSFLTLITPHSSIVIVATAWSCGIEPSVGAVTQSSFTSGASQLIQHYQTCPLTKIGIWVGNSSCAQVCVRVCMTMHNNMILYEIMNRVGTTN